MTEEQYCMKYRNQFAPQPRLHGQSPWGQIDHLEMIAPGIMFASTPSHGGYWLSKARWDRLAPLLKDLGTFGDNPLNWFEEDCDSRIVALAYPSELGVPDDLGPELKRQLFPTTTVTN